MTENYFYYDPTSDCNTCISQYDYDRLSEKDKQKYQRLDGSPNGRVYIDKENLIAENQRLKEQLDREIKINRKMKNALEKYAFENTKMEVPKIVGYSLQPQNEVDLHSPLVEKPIYDGVEEVEVSYANDTSLALQVLKEIANKE